MTRARDPQQPLPRDPDTPCRRGFLYPYEVQTEDGTSLALADDTLAEFAVSYDWNIGETPRSSVVDAVQKQCCREFPSAMRHQVRLLAIGTLGVSPREAREDTGFHEPDLDDYFAFWTGDEPDDLGGVCAENGLLCWWEARLGPGWARETGYFLQEYTDFLADGPPERVERIWIDRDVDADLRPLLAARAG